VMVERPTCPTTVVGGRNQAFHETSFPIDIGMVIE
jgi:hypothetical protein